MDDMQKNTVPDAGTFRAFLQLKDVAESVTHYHYSLADHGVEFPDKIGDLIANMSWEGIEDDELQEQFRQLACIFEEAEKEFQKLLERFEADYQANAFVEAGPFA